MSTRNTISRVRTVLISPDAVKKLDLAEAIQKCLARARLEKIRVIPEDDPCALIASKRLQHLKVKSIRKWVPDVKDLGKAAEEMSVSVLNQVVKHLRGGYAFVGFKSSTNVAVMFRPEVLTAGHDYVLPNSS